MKPSMKYNILSLIKDKLEFHPRGAYVFTKPWQYDNIYNRIEVRITDITYITIFETYGQYPMSICEEIINDHNGNLLLGMSFDDYFNIYKDEYSNSR